jgi:hypothetical protein
MPRGHRRGHDVALGLPGLSTSSTWNAKYFAWSMTKVRCASVSSSGAMTVTFGVYVAIVGSEMLT